MKDEQKIEFHNKLTACINARHRYEKVRIELGHIGQYGFITCSKRCNEEDYITDRQKVSECVAKVKHDICRLQYLVDSSEKYYDLGIESYKLWDSLCKEECESSERETK